MAEMTMRARVEPSQKREILRQTVLDAAVVEFARNGFRGGSIEEIAKAAGLSKAQLFYYFNTKSQLYEEALIHIAGIWQNLLQTADFDNGPEAFFRSYIRRRLRLSLEHPELSQLYSREIAQGAPVLRKHWQASGSRVEDVAAAIRGWIAQGLLRDVDPVLLQFNIWGITQNFALNLAQFRHLTGQEDQPLAFEELVDEVTGLVLAGCLRRQAG